MVVVLSQRESYCFLLEPSAYGIEFIWEESEQSRDTVKEDGGNP